MGKVKVSVTVDEGAISELELDTSGETPEIGGAATDKLAEQVMAAQSADIDGVSGATLTSNAVRTAVADALAQAQVVEKVAGKTFRVTFGYLSMNAVMKVLKDMGLQPSAQDFGLDCSLDVRVRLSLESDFREKLSGIANFEEK